MEQLFKVMLIPIFTALIAGSIQDILADKLSDEYNPVLLRNSEYLVHLQVVLRDAGGGLISVTESTNGYYIPHEITDEAFDYCFSPSICKKEIVVIDNKKYEKVPFAQKFGVDSPLPKMQFKIRAIVQTEENLIVDENIFSIFVPVIYIEEGEVINTQWNIFREFK
ncbi:MAG: hypothetical protein MK200_05640 [Nitrosopumilus sp.]|nr:hypothetical protein [Nitrosopumilus sp.]